MTSQRTRTKAVSALMKHLVYRMYTVKLVRRPNFISWAPGSPNFAICFRQMFGLLCPHSFFADARK